MFHDAEVFHDFTQYLQKNYELYLKIGHDNCHILLVSAMCLTH